MPRWRPGDRGGGRLCQRAWPLQVSALAPDSRPLPGPGSGTHGALAPVAPQQLARLGGTQPRAVHPAPPPRPASTQHALPSAPSPQTASGASRHPPAFAALVPRWGLPRPAWSGRLPPRPLPIPGLPPPCGWASCPPPPGRCLLPHGRPLQEAEGREGHPWAREPGRGVSADNGNAARARGDQGFRAPSGSGPGNGVEHSGVRPGCPGSQGRMPRRPGDSARGPGGGPDGAPSCVPDADGEAALPGARPLETTPRRRPCQHGTPVFPVHQPGMRSDVGSVGHEARAPGSCLRALGARRAPRPLRAGGTAAVSFPSTARGPARPGPRSLAGGFH